MGTLNVERDNRGRKLRNIYDEAKILLRQYLTKEQSIGNFESRFQIGSMNRKSIDSMHDHAITPVEGTGEEFLDISYSDIGCIVNPKNLKNGRTSTRTSLKIKNIEVQDDIEKYTSKIGSPGSQSLPELRRHTQDIGDCDVMSTEISGAKETLLSGGRKSSPEVIKLTSPRTKSSRGSSNLNDIQVEDFA